MSKAAIIAALADKAGMSKKDAGIALDTIGGVIHSIAMAGETVRIDGLGSFKKVHKAERNGRNPATGEAIRIAAKDVLTFKSSVKAK